jgi:hypothetical protein
VCGVWCVVCGVCGRDLGQYLCDAPGGSGGSGTPPHTMSVVTTPGVSASCILQDGMPVLSTLWYDSKTNLPSSVL